MNRADISESYLNENVKPLGAGDELCRRALSHRLLAWHASGQRPVV